MYSVISTVQDTLIGSLSTWDVTEYEWLQQNYQFAGTTDYQQRYKRFWGMYAALLGSDFYQTYFDFFNAPNTPMLAEICRALYDRSAHGNRKRSLQFSFATKLLHTLNPQLPIYDSFVARFYWFEPPSAALPFEERLARLMEFHQFLSDEYQRVISNGALRRSIDAFRKQFSPERHTDEKILDWLIWKFVDFAGERALLDRRIIYS